HPRFRYASQNGFIDPAKDLMRGAGLEWFSVQQWVAADQDGVTAAIVPVDAHLVTLGDIVRGAWPKEFGERKGTIFSYIMNNYWDTNWPAGQGGETRFRYVLTSGRNLSAGALSRLGWEEMSPLEVDEIKPQDKAGAARGPLPPAQYSFLQVDQPGVLLLTWKVAEDEKGTILRFVEAAGQSATVNVTVPFLKPEAAFSCNALEENQQPLTVSPHGFSFPVKPYQIVTVRLEGRSILQLP
ncbi:MAG: hypothetical protein LAP13_08195, partial [Acidobacteriia bacterium]|nr:hypothetical protein [Terriglobia bacterium]